MQLLLTVCFERLNGPGGWSDPGICGPATRDHFMYHRLSVWQSERLPIMFIIRIQFIGERAREIAQDENATNPRYPETLTKTLTALSIPYPDRIRPVWKSGVIMCHYSGELDSVCIIIYQSAAYIWVSDI